MFKVNKFVINGLKKTGQALVEFALVLVLFLTIIMGILDWGLYLYANICIDAAARDAVRTAVTHTDWSTNYNNRLAEMRDIVADRTSFLPNSLRDGIRNRVTIAFVPEINNPVSLTVRITAQPYRAVSVFQTFIPAAISAEATMRYEKN
jgi:Flp pilus assembly protein TadG